MIDVIAIIRAIQTKKVSAKVDPGYALFSEIMAEVSRQVKDELNKEVREGTLEFHNTLNDISFKIK